MSTSPATTRTARITVLHEEIVGHLRQSLEKAIELGQLLREQKAELPHGHWGQWVREHLPFSTRSSRNYMNVCAQRDLLKTENLSDLAGAYNLLRQARVVQAHPRRLEGGERRLVQGEEPLSSEELVDIMLWINRELGVEIFGPSVSWLFDFCEKDPDNDMKRDDEECLKTARRIEWRKVICFIQNSLWRGAPLSAKQAAFLNEVGLMPKQEPPRVCRECRLGCQAKGRLEETMRGTK